MTWLRGTWTLGGRPSGVTLLILLAGVSLGGCLGGETAMPGAPVEAALPAFPAAYTVPGAMRVATNETDARFVWTGEAAPAAPGVAAPPPATLMVPAPRSVPLRVAFVLHYAGDFVNDVRLVLSVTDGAGEDPCLPYAERLKAGAWVTSCHFRHRATQTAGWTITIRTTQNQVPDHPFEVLLHFKVFEPVAIPPLADAPTHHEPHVVIGTIDSGVNPYHQAFYRPDRTMHPCRYIEGYPCDVPALELSIGVYDEWEEAVVADQDTWDQVVPGQWYWIPRTALVAVACQEQSRFRPACVFDATGHGTASASNIVDENPEAFLVVYQAEPADARTLDTAPAPVDLTSMSWQQTTATVVNSGGRVLLRDCQSFMKDYRLPDRLVVFSVGNLPTSAFLHCMSADPNVITVGGAEAHGDTESILARKHPDVVSWWCRPAARVDSLDAQWKPCGTSFAAPTVAGALSKVLLELRKESGYTGSTTNGTVDPILGITNARLRDALNRTASYAPEGKFDWRDPCISPLPTCVPFPMIPLNPVAPWLQWGWGFYDNKLVNATVAHLLEEKTATKPEAAVQWMGLQHEMKRALWGS